MDRIVRLERLREKYAEQRRPDLERFTEQRRPDIENLIGRKELESAIESSTLETQVREEEARLVERQVAQAPNKVTQTANLAPSLGIGFSLPQIQTAAKP